MPRSISDRDLAHEGLGKPGLRIWPAAKYTKNTTAGATTAAVGDITGADYVVAEYSAIGTAALTLRTAAQMIADAGLQNGDTWVVQFVNTHGTLTYTITTSAGNTLTGTMTVAAGATRTCIAKVTGDGAITLQSVSIGTIA